MGAMPRFTHPSLQDVALETALHALSDPVRLGMVKALAGADMLNCSGTCPGGVPKSTLSNHLKVLRAAGLVRTDTEGREGLNRLRRAEFDARFPGLLDTVLANAASA